MAFEFLGFDLLGEYEPVELAHALRLLKEKPSTSELFSIGGSLSKSGPAPAAQFFRALSIFEPSSVAISRALGHCEKASGNFKEAAEILLGAFEADGQVADLLDAGICALEVMLPEVAIGCGQRALARSDLSQRERAIALFIVGRSLVLLGQFSEARAPLLDSLESDPSLAPACEYLLIAAANCADLSAVTNLIQQMDKAGWLNTELIQSVLEILARKSHYSSVIDVFSYANLRMKLGAVSYHLAIESARAMGKFELAYSLTKARKEKFPDFSNPGALVSEIHTLGQLCKFEEKQDIICTFDEFLAEPDRPRISINPWLLYSFVDDPEVLLESALGYSSQSLQVSREEVEARVAESRRGDSRAPGLKREKLILGFYGNEFRNHPVADCIRPLVSYSERECEIVLFSNHHQVDDVTKELMRYADGFEDCSKLDYSGTKRLVADRGVDLLIDLSVHTAGGRPDFFAKGLAPVQASYLGFSGTSGCPGYDFLFADDFIIPEDQGHLYSEKIVRLSNPLLSMNLSSFDHSRRVEERLKLGKSMNSTSVVFGFLAQAYKLTLPMAESIARILERSPNVALMVPERNFSKFERFFRSRGIDSARLISSPFQRSRIDHLVRVSACDLLLDAFPYNAHSLAADAISAGTPVLALAGRTFASRVSGSLMSGLGFTEMVCGTFREYEDLAVSLASDPGRLEVLRNQISCATRARDFSNRYASDFFRACRDLI